MTSKTSLEYFIHNWSINKYKLKPENINIKDKSDKSLLYYALVVYNNTVIGDELLRLGADINFIYINKSFLNFFYEKKNIRMFQYVLVKGIDPNHRYYGKTILHSIIQNKNRPYFDLVLEYAVNLDLNVYDNF